jgi:hypothetical protein
MLMCNRGVRHGQPLTRATGPLSPMGTGSNAVGQVTDWAASPGAASWAVHLPRRILAILARGTSRSVPQPRPLLCRSLARAASTDIKPRQPANASPVSWLASRSTAAPQHRICFLAQTLRPRLRFILLGMEDEGMTCCSASRVPSFSKARWKPDSISAAPDRVCQTIRLLLAEFHTCSSSAPDITRPLPSVSPGIGGCPGRLRSSAFPHSPAPETVDLLSNHRVASTV